MLPIERHPFGVFQFSGGKDSLACLYLLRPHWDKLIVMWVNTGAAFPETLAQMAGVRKLMPKFVEIASNQPRNVAEHGNPSDLVTVWDTTQGRQLDATRTRKVQSPLTCCAANLWLPALQACIDLGATLVIRGQRHEDNRKGPIRSGHVADGVEYWFPIEDWTSAQVRSFLHEKGVAIPDHYSYFDSSLDCMTCTAYMKENTGKLRYLKERHPETYEKVRTEISELIAASENELAHYRRAMHEASTQRSRS